jgi:hypothetical protein
MATTLSRTAYGDFIVVIEWDEQQMCYAASVPALAKRVSQPMAHGNTLTGASANCRWAIERAMRELTPQ